MHMKGVPVLWRNNANHVSASSRFLCLMCNCDFLCLAVLYCSCYNASRYIAVANFRANEVGNDAANLFQTLFYLYGPCPLYSIYHTLVTLRDTYRLMPPSIWIAPLSFPGTYSHSPSHITRRKLASFHSARTWRLQCRWNTGTISTQDTDELWKYEIIYRSKLEGLENKLISKICTFEMNEAS
jgi:hypothetical protein